MSAFLGFLSANWSGFVLITAAVALTLFAKYRRMNADPNIGLNIGKKQKKIQLEALREAPPEMFAVVFEVQEAPKHASELEDLLKKVTLGDDIYYVYAVRFGHRVYEEAIRIGKVTRREPRIIEAQGNGWMRYDMLIMEEALSVISRFRIHGLKPRAYWRLTKSDGKMFDVKVLEVRPAGQDTQIQPEAPH